ncbi:hypothetical protein [Streptococcus acidominimus]|nr:hypothetical protein [Streptococcus acidominimus]SUN07937.1 membrane protein [Streptococcus acidominimus]
MTEKEKLKLEQGRREHAIRSLYYNRYLLIRYATAFALCIYIYWVAMLYMAASPFYIMALPLVLLLFSILSMWEMAQMYTCEQASPKLTTLFYQLVFGVNLVMIVLCLAQQTSLFFPLFHTSVKSVSIIVGSHLLASLGIVGILLRLKRIEARTDRQFQRLKTYLASGA